jgi:hypothetical protein
MALEPQKPAVQCSYEDRPELPETFADSVHSLVFDGQTVRVTFTVTRVEPSPTGSPTAGKRLPTCRLVLAGGGIVPLMNDSPNSVRRCHSGAVLCAQSLRGNGG